MSPNPCDHTCTNNEGSFNCSCNNGYVLDDDQQSCNGKYCHRMMIRILNTAIH